MWALAIASYIRDLTFNVANWVFCFEYFRTASLIPYFINSDTVSVSFTRRLDYIFYGVLYCNFIAPFLRAFCLLLADLNGIRENSTRRSQKSLIFSDIEHREVDIGTVLKFNDAPNLIEKQVSTDVVH